jgi:hypothetical protein
MAGFGRRFLERGYTIPKYRIEAGGRTLFEWSLRGLSEFADAGWRFCFILRREDAARDFVAQNAAALGLGDTSMLELDAPTDGQATTAQLAAERADADQPFAIFNIDTALAPGALRPGQIQGDGWIPCVDAPGEGWSFVRLGPSGTAEEVREKSRISNHASIGFYFFASARLYRDVYRSYYSDASRLERGEKYVAPLYNGLIGQGLSVHVQSISLEQVAFLGTPDEVDAFARDADGRFAAISSASPDKR